MKKGMKDFSFHRNMKRKKLYLLPPIVLLLFLVTFQRVEASHEITLDWSRIAMLKPDLKVLVLLEGEQAISLKDLATLAELGMVPADRDPGLVIGLRQAIFSTRLQKWMTRPFLPSHMKGKLLERFVMSGIYRIGFRVEQEGYLGPLSFEITAPRESFGKRLLFYENLVRPQTPGQIHIDSAENRWFLVDYPEVKYGQTIKFFFAFRYLVDVAALLDHDLILVEKFEDTPIPEEVRPFLTSGYKIDTQLPQAVDWANRGRSGPANVRTEYQRLTKYLKDSVAYDKTKRDRYFGGKSIYYDLDEMYQDIKVTLSRRIGACPDTTLIECAFLRARGIPCRIAGRHGHFFSLVYVPSKGWMSTSVTPTGVPLFIAPGSDHIPYQKWRPSIPLRTILLELQSRIEKVEE